MKPGLVQLLQRRPFFGREEMRDNVPRQTHGTASLDVDSYLCVGAERYDEPVSRVAEIEV